MDDHRDESAFGAGRARLVALARRVHGTEEAEDVVQEVLARLLERGTGDLRSADAWLTTSVRNAAIDARRRASLHRRTLELLAGDASGTELPSSELGDEIGRLVDAAVATFGTPTAAALLLRVSFDLSYDELARDSGHTAAAWRQRLHRALQRLRAGAVERRRLDDDEARAAAICRSALASGEPARLHALVRTSTVARALPPPVPATAGRGRATPELALVNGRYVLALVMDGCVLCALPVGTTDDLEPETVDTRR